MSAICRGTFDSRLIFPNSEDCFLIDFDLRDNTTKGIYREKMSLKLSLDEFNRSIISIQVVQKPEVPFLPTHHMLTYPL